MIFRRITLRPDAPELIPYWLGDVGRPGDGAASAVALIGALKNTARVRWRRQSGRRHRRASLQRPVHQLADDPDTSSADRARLPAFEVERFVHADGRAEDLL